MLLTFVLVGGGAWLLSNVLDKAMAGPNAMVFGRFPANQLATGLGILGLLAAPVFGPLAPLVAFAGGIGAAGGILSVMNQSGVRLLPRMGSQNQIQGDDDLGYPHVV